MYIIKFDCFDLKTKQMKKVCQGWGSNPRGSVSGHQTQPLVFGFCLFKINIINEIVFFPKIANEAQILQSSNSHNINPINHRVNVVYMPINKTHNKNQTYKDDSNTNHQSKLQSQTRSKIKRRVFVKRNWGLRKSEWRVVEVQKGSIYSEVVQVLELVQLTTN